MADLHVESTVQDNTDHSPQNNEDVQKCHVVVPTIGMKFESEDEIYSFYNNYAYQMGFGVRISSKRKRPHKTYYALGCHKGGVYESKAEPSKQSKSCKTDCPAKISVIVDYDGTCTISCVSLEHNHALSPRKSRFQRSHKKIDSYSKRRLELNDSAGISLAKNFHSLVVEAEGYENLAFGERDCRNYIAKARQLRLGKGDAEALRDYFVRMQKRSTNFFYVIDMDDEGRLKNVFWADARSRAAYQSFGDVVSFDSTYLTNKYNMPFAPFVGVNHHGQSMLFGCGLVSREDTETYVWLFKSWLECMDGHAPKAIITDQCRAIQGAVARVFPDSLHRLCLWHIMKKVPEKLGKLNKYKAIKKTLKSLVYESIQSQEFEDGWSQMIKEYAIDKNDWLCSLFDDRKRWVPLYVKVIFWAGMSTTQRSEGMNAFFDDYVNSKTSLRQFVEQYDNALKSKIEKETKADFDSLNASYKLMTGFHFEKQFQASYTNAMFKLVQIELQCMLFCNHSLLKTQGTISTFNVTDILRGKRGELKRKVVYTVSFDEVGCDIQCSCHSFEFRGIVCRHMMKILIEKDVKEIPSCYILSRWRKDLKHRHYHVINCYEDLKSGGQAKQFEQLCSSFYEVAHIANSQEKYDYLLRCIASAKEKLSDDSSWGVNTNTNTISKDNDIVSEPKKPLLPSAQYVVKGAHQQRGRNQK
ncbi:protein FAR-RED IMPAIRED RESPONSE 1-like [Rutidosis leptorrhynchoides]|uniref:protein FAR-RED IMPAIRED RESPONSE 1-like n=1 Tax=Rutidosis leptorrhynchoides TaxID=125765 RepID=UPI003A9A1D7A